MLAERLRFLERVAALYEADIASLRREDLADIEQDGWKALEIFLAYAYERQGASPAYAPAARETIQTLANQGASWTESGLAKQAWRLYTKQLKGQPLNEQNNPMCPEGTRYKKGERETWQVCVIGFAQKNLSDVDYNIVRWAKKALKAGGVQAGHKNLTSISGVGNKIASFFLRDAAWAHRIVPDQSRELLQPIDVWVRRYVYHWAGKMSDAKCATWIVKESLHAGASPEKVNAGMWYFGARVAGNRHTLMQQIDDVKAMQEAMEDHVNWMSSQVAVWRDVMKDV